jgi:transaldolase
MCRPTVNTVPEKTLNAFLDHGVVKEAFTGKSQEAQATLQEFKECGVDIQEVCQKLLNDGVAVFEKSFDELLHSIEEKIRQLSVAAR